MSSVTDAMMFLRQAEQDGLVHDWQCLGDIFRVHLANGRSITVPTKEIPTTFPLTEH